MNTQIKKRLLRSLIIVAIGLSIGALMGVQQVLHQNHTSKKIDGFVGLKVGGPFTLTDQNNHTVTDQTYKGQYKLIYFGFTYCPAVCPTELQKISKVLKALGPNGDRIQPLFITVDPERDTVETMKNYVSLFHPRIVGLTGTPDQIKTTLQEFHVYANKVQDQSANDYTMDHSSFIYFMDGDDNLLGLYRSEDTAENITADIQSKLGHP